MEKKGWPKPEDWMHRHEETGSAELTEEEERIFEELGLDLDPISEDELDPVELGRQQFLRLVTSGSFAVEEVAGNLKKSPGTIKRWIDERCLFAIWHQSRWRIPKFQFSECGRRLISGIEDVNIRIPFDWHPIGIENWYHLPNCDLEIGEQSLSPIEWLRSRQDPMPLLRAAEMLRYPSFQ